MIPASKTALLKMVSDGVQQSMTYYNGWSDFIKKILTVRVNVCKLGTIFLFMIKDSDAGRLIGPRLLKYRNSLKLYIMGTLSVHPVLMVFVSLVFQKGQ